jgi:multiple sugar transport system permease protein
MATTTAPARRPRPARRSASRAQRRETFAALGFLSPWIFGFVVFTAGPIIYSLYLAFTDYDIINEPEFIGTANFQEMMEDPRVRRALANTFIFAVMKVPLTMATALALAMLLLRVGRAVGLLPAGDDARCGRRHLVPAAVQRRLRHRQPGTRTGRDRRSELDD